MSFRAKSIINTKNLLHNLQVVQQKAPQRKVLAMIKADAYGHGLLTVANTLKDHVAGFGVAAVETAVMLRDHAIQNPIVVLGGLTSPAEADLIFRHNLQFVLHDMAQVEFFLKQNFQQVKTIWLKVDTGMNRMGIAMSQLNTVLEKLKPHHVILMSHFACADEPEHPLNQTQSTRCLSLKSSYPNYACSFANSALIFSRSDLQADWVRPGIMLYGASPLLNVSAADLNLLPVMTLKSRLISIKQVPKGETVGYGATWCSPELKTIGVVSIGYADGYPRQALSGTPVLIRQQICPIVGRVSMDVLSVDLTNCPNAQLGDEVILWGEGLPVERIAEKASTISYQLLTALTKRVDRLAI